VTGYKAPAPERAAVTELTARRSGRNLSVAWADVQNGSFAVLFHSDRGRRRLYLTSASSLDLGGSETLGAVRLDVTAYDGSGRQGTTATILLPAAPSGKQEARAGTANAKDARPS
jgi:hypothetical protein